MYKKEAHRFKHRIVVSDHLSSDIDNKDDKEMLTVMLGQNLSSEKLFAKIHHELGNLSGAMHDGSPGVSDISFFAYSGEHDNHSTYEQRATLIMDAIQSFSSRTTSQRLRLRTSMRTTTSFVGYL